MRVSPEGSPIKTRRRVGALVVGIALLLLGGFFLLDRPARGPSRSSEPPPRIDVTEDAVSWTPAERGPVAREPLPSATSVARTVPPAPTHQCSRDQDCTGPHSPDCVRARCVDRACRYDRSSCACIANEQCDDADPCTTDLCFARTNACVHVQEGCADQGVR